MKTITILSGKGGVGKSSIAASLAIALSKDNKIICADCDVDASNLALVFGVKEEEFVEWNSITTNLKAKFDPQKCNGCKKCVESCYFDAIDWDTEKNKPIFKEFGCEGCGVCELVCPQDAISLYPVDNAKIGYGETNYGFKVVSGQLEIGESGSGKVVAAVKDLARKKAGDASIMIVDSAAGIGCPVIASVTGSDYVIAVTEPTPSGFSDLKRALEVVNHFKIPYGIIINKHDLNPDYTQHIEDFAKQENITVLSKIPYDKKFTNALVDLKPIIVSYPEFENLFKDISLKINKDLNRK